MSTMTTLNNRQVCKLMRSWGFEEAGGSGGHIVMRHVETDKKVQVTAPGRRTPTPETALRKAAAIVGVPLHDFKAGPPEKPKPATRAAKPPTVAELEVIDLTDVLPPINGNGNGNGHQPEPEPEPEPEGKRKRRRPAQEILALLQGSPNICFKVQEIADRTGLYGANQISPALRALMAKHPEIQKVSHGVYKWDQPAPVVEEKSIEDAVEEARRRARTYEKVTDDVHGRAVLRDMKGELWVAVRVAPDFYPLTPPVAVAEPSPTS